MIPQEDIRGDLLVLQVKLDTSSCDPAVKFKLKNWSGGARTELFKRRYNIQAFGFPFSAQELTEQSRRGDDWFHLPSDFISLLESAVAPVRDRPLWLQFKQPCGFLALAPWETQLSTVVNRSVLRLPSAIAPDPAEYADTLDVVICCSSPDDEAQFRAVDHMRQAIGTINSLSRDIKIHVFTDAPAYQIIKSNAWPLPNTTVYDPAGAPTTTNLDCQDAITNPWLRWMRDELLKVDRFADCVVFVSHGFYDEGRGAIALASAPQWISNNWSQFLYARDLVPFLQQVGAWSIGLCAPTNNYSYVGLRALMEEVAQTKPGPVFYFDYNRDVQLAGLAALFRFLFSPPNTQPAPVSPAMALYCQPFRGMMPQQIVGHVPEETAASLAAVASSWDIGSVVSQQGSLPSWVGAAERYLEAQRFQMLQARQDIDPNSQAADNFLATGLALDGLQALVSQAANQFGSAPPSPGTYKAAGGAD